MEWLGQVKRARFPSMFIKEASMIITFLGNLIRIGFRAHLTACSSLFFFFNVSNIAPSLSNMKKMFIYMPISKCKLNLSEDFY